MAKWNIDPDHSVAAFNVRHMMAAHVRGQFNKLSGSARFDPADRSSFSLEVTIDATGLYTGIAQRDAHLSSPDFFDLAIYPTISFKSTGFKASDGGGRLAGDLTIHGVTQPITLDVKFSGPVTCPEDFGGETILGITATASINREEFGMSWNMPMNDGGVVVGKDIWIDLDIEADLEE
ncbi:MAG: YceI family protein [Deltaproteobacteria bacterium]|nr:YceI family protein [Deltaproteobacteria bacterium]